MIALLDVNGRSVILFKKDGVDKVSFDEIDYLAEYVKDEKIFYVTNAVLTNTDDIINLVYELKGEKRPSFENVDENETLYIHCMDEGTVYIDEELKFEGRFDIKKYDTDMQELVQNSPILQTLIKKKKIEIVGEGGKNRLMKDYKRALSKRLERDKIYDTQLDKIIVQNGRAEDVAAAGGLYADANDDDFLVEDNENIITESERTYHQVGGLFDV